MAPTAAGESVFNPAFQGQTIFANGFIPAGAAGTVNGTQTPVGGLSGVTYDALNKRYYAISDDRSQVGPARFYTFTADLSSGTLGANGVTFTNATPLKDANGNLFAALSLDPEGIALTPGGTVFISSEGEVNPGAGRVTNPFINEFSLTTGQQVRALSVPKKFLPAVQDTNNNGVVDAGDTQTAGVRNNLAFESLTISPDQKTLFTATEDALFQDGPTISASASSRSRIIQYNLTSGQPEKEYLYNIDAVTGNGLVDLLAIDNRGTLLALERSFAVGVGNNIKIYEITLQGATDISATDSLSALTSTQLSAIQPAQKRLLLDLSSLKLPTDANHPITGLDNIEGITFGPKLPDGRQSIVLVSDNNFSSTQFTQILTLGADLVPTVAPTVETPANFNDSTLPFSQRADSDDPAIYVNPTNAANSLVITTAKNAGMRVYDLAGNQLQSINPDNIRYNNVDLVYGFQLGNQTVDLAVASDRNNDKLAIFKVNPNPTTPGAYLENITDPNISTFFQGAPYSAPYSASTRSAYGLATYTSPVTGDDYVFINRRQTGDVAQLKLVGQGNGKVTATLVRSFTIPLPPNAPTVSSPQTEGSVADRETGFFYIAQEDVGIWKFNAEPNGGNTGTLVDVTKDLGGKHIAADAEGLTIYYGANGKGYLLASSQGDSTFAAYAREGNNDYLGQFAVGTNGSIDSVQESDGADVLNLPLGPNFPFGLFVTQDGRNLPEKLVNGENVNTNFKLVPFENIANAFPNPLKIDTTSYDPRNPQPNSLLNGVGSGDTTQTSTVLWARSNFTGTVLFEYSTTPTFTVIVGTAAANVTNPLQPVKVNVSGLKPGTDYYYRAIDIAGDTATGKFSTAVTAGTRTGLRFGISGDWRGELSPYPAISNADERDLKFFLEFGDTIYADYPSAAVKNPDGTPKAQAETLDEYRAKHSEVYSSRFGQNTWGDLRASTSIFATLDDHEVTNDFAGGALASSDARFKDTTPGKLINDTALFENGVQAFQEYNPIRDEFYGNTGDPRTAGERKLYRYNTFGSDAATYVLDARSFRDTELPDASLTNPIPFLVSSFDPTRTLLGRQQVADLKRDLLDARNKGITWKYVMIPEPIQNLGVVGASDRYEGYAAERTEILKFIKENNINNVVFVTADIHGTLVNNLTYQEFPGGPQIATNAFEISTGSVAFDAPFGQTVAGLSALLGFLTPEQLAFYQSLPTAGKDTFIKSLVNSQLTQQGYDPLGLDNNLPTANGLINAQLLKGDYITANTFGWSEFNIDKDTQQLKITTYGIEPYTEAQLLSDPVGISNRTPQVLSEFVVTPVKKQQIDFNNDGKPDVVVRNGKTGENTIALLDGTTITQFVPTTPVPDTNWKIGGAGDFNNDGKTDVVLRNQATGENAISLMDGTTISQIVFTTPVPDLNWTIGGVGDFNNDGKADVVLRNGKTGENAIALMNGTTVSQIVAATPVPDLNWEIGGVGDFNKDGKDDVVFRNRATGENAFALLNGTTLIQTVSTQILPNLNWTIGAVGDYNRDGNADVLFRNQVTGENVFALLNGTNLSQLVATTTVADNNWQIGA